MRILHWTIDISLDCLECLRRCVARAAVFMEAQAADLTLYQCALA